MILKNMQSIGWLTIFIIAPHRHFFQKDLILINRDIRLDELQRLLEDGKSFREILGPCVNMGVADAQ